MTNRAFALSLAAVTLAGVAACLQVARGEAVGAAEVAVPPPAPVSAQPCAAEPPRDPFQATARAVLAGKYGKQPEWKLNAYRLGLERGVTVKGNVFLTCYWDSEGHDSTWDCRGRKCGDRHIACNRLPLDTIVWVQWPVYDWRGRFVNVVSQMCVVLDRGAKKNDRVADHQGCDLWMDRHTSRPYETQIGQYAIIGKP